MDLLLRIMFTGPTRGRMLLYTVQYSVQYNIHSVIDWFALLMGAPWRLPTHQTKYKCNEEEGGKEETRSTIHYTDTQGMMLVSSLNG